MTVVEIPPGSGNRYKYVYEGGKTVYKGPVGTAPELSEGEFLEMFQVQLTGPEPTNQDKANSFIAENEEKIKSVIREGLGEEYAWDLDDWDEDELVDLIYEILNDANKFDELGEEELEHREQIADIEKELKGALEDASSTEEKENLKSEAKKEIAKLKSAWDWDDGKGALIESLVSDLELEDGPWADSFKYEHPDEPGEWVAMKEDDAKSAAIEDTIGLIEEMGGDLGDFVKDHVDEKKAKNYFEMVYTEWDESYIEDIRDEKSSDEDEWASRLEEEIEEWGVDDEDELREVLTKSKLDEGRGGFDYYANNFGEDEAFKVADGNGLIDMQAAAEFAVNTDGWAHSLSGYDGNYSDMSGGYVTFRTN